MCSRILLPRVLSDDGEGKLQTTVYVRVGDIPLGIIFSLLILTMIMVKYRHECKRI
jgi:apolipoprotein N-acyltransferase